MSAMLVEDKKEEKKTPERKGGGVKKRGVDKWKKKVWYAIFSPEEFEKREIGQTVAEKPEFVLGRTITMSAGEIAKQPRLSHVSIRFKVSDVQGQKAFTQLQSFAVADSYTRRIVRRRSSKLQVVQSVLTKDGFRARVKMITITGQKVTQAQGSAIRKIMSDELDKAAGAREFRVLVQELMFGNLSSGIAKRAKKIAGVKRVEVTKCVLLEEKQKK